MSRRLALHAASRPELVAAIRAGRSSARLLGWSLGCLASLASAHAEPTKGPDPAAQVEVNDGPAPGGDFDPSAPGWNALSYLRATAAEADVEVVVGNSLDFSLLSGDEVLLIVGPLARLDGNGQQQLRAFVRAGGRLVVADDFRAGATWLAPFGLRLVDEAGAAAQTVTGAPSLMRFPGADIGGFLGFQVGEIVLNHPAAMLVESPAVVRGEESQTQRIAHGRYVDGVRAWLVEVRMGRGRMLGLADPSVLIDGMLRSYHGDKQFAANLLRWGCYAGERCAVRLLPNLRQVGGVFVPPAQPHGGRGNLLDGLSQVLAWLGELLRRPEFGPIGWALTLAMLSLPLLRAARLLPPRRPRPAVAPRQSSRLHGTVEAWLNRPEANYQQPARLLASHLVRMVQAAESGTAQRIGSRPRTPVDPIEEIEDLHGLLPRGPGRALAGAQPAITRLIQNGSLSASAGQRLLDVVAALGDLIRGDEQVDRARFAAIAAEVEWAEHVLIRAAHGRMGAGAGAAVAGTLGGLQRRPARGGAAQGGRG